MLAFGASGFDPVEIISKSAANDASAVLDQFGRSIGVANGAEVAAAATGTVGGQQFYLYEIGPGEDPLLDPHLIDPVLDGSDHEPDAIAQIELEAFNFGQGMKVDADTRATLRLDIGKDKQSRSDADLLLWSAASAIDLARQISQRKKPSDLSFKGSDVFKRRPAEIPGGLAQIRIEVVKHPEPSLWRKIFDAATGSGAQALIQTLGFPGITLDVVRFLDDTFNQYLDNKAEVLFQSQPLTMALTKRAKKDFVMDNPRVLAASLNPNRYVVVGQKDAAALRAAKPLYLSGPGVLVPEADYQAQRSAYDQDKNALNSLTYGILRVRARTAELVNSLNP